MPLLLLALAPLGAGLLRLALSREHAGEADLEAAELTGDPTDRGAALAGMRWRERVLIEARFPGMRLLRVPALFRDHPVTEERIRRLRALPRRPDAAVIENPPD